MDAHNFSTASRYLLSIQFLLGGQARLLPQLTPGISKVPYASADGFRRVLRIIPSSNSTQHTRIIGWLLTAGGLFLLIPRNKNTPRHGFRFVLAKFGEGLAVVLPAMFAYAHFRLGMNMALPAFNLLLAGIMFNGRGRPEYGIRDDAQD